MGLSLYYLNVLNRFNEPFLEETLIEVRGDFDQGDSSLDISLNEKPLNFNITPGLVLNISSMLARIN